MREIFGMINLGKQLRELAEGLDDTAQERPSKWHHGQGKAFQNNSKRRSWQDQRSQKEKNSQQEKLASKKDELTGLVRIFIRARMRPEDDSARMRAEPGFMVFCNIGDHGILGATWEISQMRKKKEE